MCFSRSVDFRRWRLSPERNLTHNLFSSISNRFWHKGICLRTSKDIHDNRRFVNVLWWLNLALKNKEKNSLLFMFCESVVRLPKLHKSSSYALLTKVITSFLYKYRTRNLRILWKIFRQVSKKKKEAHLDGQQNFAFNFHETQDTRKCIDSECHCKR